MKYGQTHKRGYSFANNKEISEIQRILNNLKSDGSIIITRNAGSISLQLNRALLSTSSNVRSLTITGYHPDYDGETHSKPWYTDDSHRIIKAYNLADYETIPTGTTLLGESQTENPYVDTDGNPITDEEGETQSKTVYYVFPPVYLGP